MPSTNHLTGEGGDDSGNGANNGPSRVPRYRDATPKITPENPFADIEAAIDSEPADPTNVDHGTRRKARIADEHADPSNLSKLFVECGCGDCPSWVDPLAEEPTGPFQDAIDRKTMAADVCDDPRPVTIEKAAEVALRYEIATYKSAKTSRLGDAREYHSEAMEAERDLLDRWGDDVTTVLLSLRLPPIEELPASDVPTDPSADNAAYNGPSRVDAHSPATDDNRGNSSYRDDVEATIRKWLPPLTIDRRLRDGWDKAYSRLRTSVLRDYEWAYCWLVATTDSAATPHLHAHLWVRDPDDDELTESQFEFAVDGFVSEATGARKEDNPVVEGESDAVVVETDPNTYDYNVDPIEGENTAGFAYLLHQRPQWQLAPLYADDTDGEVTDVDKDAFAISWASPRKWISSGQSLSF